MSAVRFAIVIFAVAVTMANTFDHDYRDLPNHRCLDGYNGTVCPENSGNSECGLGCQCRNNGSGIWTCVWERNYFVSLK
uniref:Defensin n=1 Tax=Rhipicephalus zambeziensis TaxID=60191 RepID=A0A224YI92_9ACAR